MSVAPPYRTLKGTLRKYNGVGNGNFKKAIRLVSKRITLHVHHAFFVDFFAAPVRLRGEMTKFKFFSRTETARR